MTTFTRATVNVRAWPGRDKWRTRTPRDPYVKSRPALIVHAASDAAADTDVLAWGTALEVSGASVVGAVVIIPDGATPARRKAAVRLARELAVDGLSGPIPWRVETASAFGDPKTGTLLRRAYAGGWCLAGWDIGRSWSLFSAADLQVECSGKNKGAWRIGPTGSVTRHDDGGVKAVSPHRPPWVWRSRRVGWMGTAGVPASRNLGKREHGRPFTGDVLDLHTAAYVLTSERSATPERYGELLGVEGLGVPTSVAPDLDGLRRVMTCALDLHRLTVTLDVKAGQWFTTPRDRTEGRHRLDLSRTASPGGLASGILERSGLRPPMETWDLDDEGHGRWAESFHGGWTEVAPAIVGRVFPAVVADISSAYPLAAVLLGWWDFLCAERVEMHDDTADFVRFAHEVAGEPGVLHRDTFKRFGMDLVTLTLDGTEGPYPVEVDDPHRPDGRLEVVPVDSGGRVMHKMGSDVLAAIVRGGDVPAGIVSVTRPVAVGRQSQIRRRLPVLPGLALDLTTDIVGPIIDYRSKCKDKGDTLGAALTRVIVNSLVFGQLARMDPDGDGERPGPWVCLPLASAITAGARLILALMDRGVTGLGGMVAARATDSSIIPSSVEGGAITLAGGDVGRVLSHVDLGAVLRDLHRRFSPGRHWPLFKITRGTADRALRAVIFGVNRHAEFYLDGDGGDTIELVSTTDDDVEGETVDLVNTTQATLANFYAAPATMPGTDADGTCEWVRVGVTELIRHARAKEAGPSALRPKLSPWDVGEEMPWPAIRRLSVTSPELLHTLPECLGARMGTRYLEAGGVVALDPGDDLARWQTLRWVYRDKGDRAYVTTDHEAPGGAAQLDTLDSKMVAWSWPTLVVPVEAVEVGLVQRVGRVSGVLDAWADGLGNLDARRPVDVDAASFVTEEARRLGPTGFARTYGVAQRTAERLTAGHPPSLSTVRRVRQALRALHTPALRTCGLDGCAVTVSGKAIYCTEAHKKRAHRKARARLADPYADDDVCAVCDAVLWGVPLVDGRCPDCLEDAS
ncbi:MAG TPA: hypothetical protein VN799_00020 [Acidimicrobiales bacterium]|nr:hypothetical protein [Acidimicrobiales bacterium]